MIKAKFKFCILQTSLKKVGARYGGMVSGCYYWPQKSSATDFCAKRICCSNIFLFQGMKISLDRRNRKITCNELKIGANTPIPV